MDRSFESHDPNEYELGLNLFNLPKLNKQQTDNNWGSLFKSM